MQDLFLARPWKEVKRQLEAEGIRYEAWETRSPRSFFPVDSAKTYVVRVRQDDHGCTVIHTPAPARSDTVAAYEEELR